MTREQESRELLGMFVDLSLKVIPGPKGRWVCVHCRATADTPPQMRHISNCLVVRAQDNLRKYEQ